MTKQCKRFTLWTAVIFLTGTLAGGALKATLDALATRQGWHLGGEVLVLGVIVALPLVWLWGVKVGSMANPGARVKDVAQKAMMGSINIWR